MKKKVEAEGGTLERCTNFFSKKDGGLTNKFENPPCLHLNVKLKSGWIYEVMFMLSDFATAKEIIHKYYEAERAEEPAQLLIPIFGV